MLVLLGLNLCIYWYPFEGPSIKYHVNRTDGMLSFHDALAIVQYDSGIPFFLIWSTSGSLSHKFNTTVSWTIMVTMMPGRGHSGKGVQYAVDAFTGEILEKRGFDYHYSSSGILESLIFLVNSIGIILIVGFAIRQLNREYPAVKNGLSVE